MHNKNHEDLVLDDSAEIVENEPVEKIEETECEVTGVVTNCLKLNIRENPGKDSEVVTIVNCLDKLNVLMHLLMIGMLSEQLQV